MVGNLQLKLDRNSVKFETEAACDLRARVERLEAAGREVLHLERGAPDFPTPAHIASAGARAIKADPAASPVPAGNPALREAIAHAAEARGLTASADNVLVTGSSRPMLFYSFLALVERGDEVLVPDPAHPIYQSAVRFARGRPVPYRVDVKRPEGLDVEEVTAAISPRTRVLVLNSPHNPTGTVVELATLDRLASLAIRHDLTVVADEVYARLAFEGWRPSIASLGGMAERTVVVDSFSKTYAMSDWRLGYGLGPAALMRQVGSSVIAATGRPPAFVQEAGLAALTGPQDCVREMREEFRARLRLLVTGLNEIEGISCAMPRGGFYAFPRVSTQLESRGLTAEWLADILLEEFGLACLPGATFGAAGSGHLRLSVAVPQADLRRALQCLRTAVQGRVSPGSSHRASHRRSWTSRWSDAEERVPARAGGGV